MKKITFFLFLFLSLSAFSQQHFFYGVQADYGPFGRTFDQNKTMLKGTNIGRMFNIRLSGSYRLFDQLTIEGGASLNGLKWKLTDQQFEERNEGFESLSEVHTRYMSYFANLKYSYNLGRKKYIFLRATYEYSAIGGGELYESKRFVSGNDFIEMTVNFGQNNQAFAPEIGYEYFNSQGNLISLGLKYHRKFSGDNLIRADYHVNNQVDYEEFDGINISGSYVALTAQFNGLLSYKAKKERVKKEKIKIIIPKDSTTPEKVEIVDSTEKVVVDNKTANDRDYAVTHKVKVRSDSITIYVWDHQIEDGDRVNLILNGEWILTDYTITKKKLILKAKLKPGTNTFILYALNLGKYSPNTAAIMIYDGVKQHEVILSSTLDESSAIDIKYDPK